MGVNYVHCPHCAFPSVVRKIEKGFARHCRQCRRTFVPDDCVEPVDAKAAEAHQKRNGNRKIAIRQLLKQFAMKGNR